MWEVNVVYSTGVFNRYWVVFKMAILDIFEYRFDFFTNMIKYAFNISMMALIWTVVQQVSLKPPAMSVTQTITYFVLGAMIYSLSNFHTHYIETDIRLGNLTKYLTKPINPFRYYYAFQASPIVVETLIKALILVTILVSWGGLGWPGMTAVLLFLAFLPLIYTFTFSLYFFISSLAFWMQDAYAVRWGLIIVFRFLSGLLVPISLYPLWAQQLSFWGPFQHLAFTPIQLLQGQLSPLYALKGWFILGGWTLLMTLIRKRTWTVGLQQFEGSGL